ncbi:MAG: glycosidase [Acholeplasma sp.]|jgi:GH43 family beta-xylosidase|nr:MAG: glycosidase [Acholeplasma sp.]
MKNPIGITNIGDPFILKHNDRYYLYATSFIDGFYCWVSDDLNHWDHPIQVYTMSERSFGYKDFWAPEVVYHHGKFVMHYSARSKMSHSLRIGVAIADHPLGPFIDVYDGKPMFDFEYATIDGHVFSEQGHHYFYFDKDCSEHIYEGRHESHIYMAELDETLTQLITEPIFIMKPEQDWEISTGQWRWNEGPFIIKDQKDYYLMYSAGFYASSSYSIGYAKSQSPLGPFVKAEENPILKSIEGHISGPGHNSVVKGPDQTLICVYHVHTHHESPSENRQVFMDKIVFEQGKLKIIGPTLGININE